MPSSFLLLLFHLSSLFFLSVLSKLFFSCILHPFLCFTPSVTSFLFSYEPYPFSFFIPFHLLYLSCISSSSCLTCTYLSVSVFFCIFLPSVLHPVPPALISLSPLCLHVHLSSISSSYYLSFSSLSSSVSFLRFFFILRHLHVYLFLVFVFLCIFNPSLLQFIFFLLFVFFYSISFLHLSISCPTYTYLSLIFVFSYIFPPSLRLLPFPSLISSSNLLSFLPSFFIFSTSFSSLFFLQIFLCKVIKQSGPKPCSRNRILTYM
jgi:hypothetical protein